MFLLRLGEILGMNVLVPRLAAYVTLLVTKVMLTTAETKTTTISKHHVCCLLVPPINIELTSVGENCQQQIFVIDHC